MAEQARLIKKYPNRRLYDTRTSTYITLADVKELVLKQEEFQVVDAKTSEDLTRSILLQIILEEEAAGTPMFSLDVLTQMIRFYGNAMQGMMGKYLENNVNAFTDMQKKFQEQALHVAGDNNAGAGMSKELWSQFLSFQGPAMQSVMGTYVEQSARMFQQMQDNMQEQTRKLFSGFQMPAGYTSSDAQQADKPGEKK
jgi:polyhydroxyalkanoate synthesis repressor PhaR